MILSNLDFSDLRKSRRSVLAVSAAILVLSGTELISDTLSLFGLQIRVSLADIIFSLQVLLIILLIVFALRSIELAPKQVLRVLFYIDRAWEKSAKSELDELERRLSDPSYDPDENPFDDYDSFYFEGRWKRRRRRERVLSLKPIVQGIVALITEFLGVLLISLTALIWPDALSDLSNSISKIDEAESSERAIAPPGEDLGEN